MYSPLLNNAGKHFLATTINPPRCTEFTDDLGNVVKQITIVGEARVSRDFVQVPELVCFRLLLSHPAGDPLNYGLLFINFPDTFPFRTV